MKNINTIALVIFFLIAGFTANAQQHRFNGHKTVAQTPAEIQLRNPTKSQEFFKTSLYKTVPANIILPGEFEESQSVAISWSFDYDSVGNVIGADTSTVYADISAQLADAIQNECLVWIRVNAAKDSNSVLNFMKTYGYKMTNYKFIVALGDDWWTRDYGPMAFYSKNTDSIGFVDMMYYDGRENDNIFPSQLAQKLGYQNYITQLNGEGGNLMTDGFGKLVFSSVIPTVNADGNIHPVGWTQQQTYDTLTKVFNTPELLNLKQLNCDGGTGHIDLYIKFMDEQTLFIAQYPSAIKATDRQIIEDNVQYVTGLKSTYNRPFRIFRVEDPTDDNGNYSLVTCSQINGDARNFINGLTVNNTFIFPSYYDGQSGNAAQHARIMAQYKRLLPGYNIVPIDSRDMSPLGGAIHCITMQIPAENPIRFWHPSVDGLQPNLSKYHLVAKVTNKSGIASTTCKWRKNGGAWNTVSMTDSSGYFIGDIVNPGLTGADSIEYYLTSTSVNGKTATKPFTALRGGYYALRLAWPNGLTQQLESKNHLFTAFPNPAAAAVKLQFKLASDANEVTLKLFDISGKSVYSRQFNKVNTGMYETDVDISSLPDGLYFYSLEVDNQHVMGKKLMIAH